MKNTRIVFMGTPLFACDILKSLIEEGYNVVGVVSQPDKKVGRKQEIELTPVKKLALEHGISVVQPLKIKLDFSEVAALEPELIVTCAYGQIVPKGLLDLPRFGCLNVHASLLPKLRGGAPIHKSIIYGEEYTGISIMRMVEKMDAGAYMMQESVKIEESDTAGSLHDKLKVLGSSMIKRAIPQVIEGTAIFVEQDESNVTYAWNISKEEERINLNESITTVYNQIRGLIPWPVGYIMIEGKKCKLWSVRKEEVQHNEVIGLLVIDQDVKIAVQGGYIIIDELQLEGKGKIQAKQFINGSAQKFNGVVVE